MAPRETEDDHGDDHEDHGKLGPGVQHRVMGLIAAAQEHFGDREPTEQEARQFFEQLLTAEGISQEEIDRILS